MPLLATEPELEGGHGTSNGLWKRSQSCNFLPGQLTSIGSNSGNPGGLRKL